MHKVTQDQGELCSVKLRENCTTQWILSILKTQRPWRRESSLAALNILVLIWPQSLLWGKTSLWHPVELMFSWVNILLGWLKAVDWFSEFWEDIILNDYISFYNFFGTTDLCIFSYINVFCYCNTIPRAEGSVQESLFNSQFFKWQGTALASSWPWQWSHGDDVSLVGAHPGLGEKLWGAWVSQTPRGSASVVHTSLSPHPYPRRPAMGSSIEHHHRKSPSGPLPREPGLHLQ